MADRSAVDEIREALRLVPQIQGNAIVAEGELPQAASKAQRRVDKIVGMSRAALARLDELEQAIAEAERRGYERATRGHIELISALAFLSARDGVGYRPEEIFRRARANGWRDDDDRVGASERAKGGA